jgi:hypothetical protein
MVSAVTFRLLLPLPSCFANIHAALSPYAHAFFYLTSSFPQLGENPLQRPFPQA